MRALDPQELDSRLWDIPNIGARAPNLSPLEEPETLLTVQTFLQLLEQF